MKQVLPPLIHNKSLATLSTLAIGGEADFYIEVKCVSELQDALVFCKNKGLPFFILGKGSNCLFDDRGFKGCIIHNKIDFLNPLEPGRWHVGAGFSFSRLGTHTAKNGYSGLEFASGIPASVGGAIYMNAGANGSETKDMLESIHYIDENGKAIIYQREELVFEYRKSSFQMMKGAIAGAIFKLQANDKARTTQFDIINYRKKTQPYNAHSAGCVFRNPAHDNAGRLIEACGLKKFAIGQAEVSEMHANFFINKDASTAQDFKQLIEIVKKEVKNKTQIELECEIRMIPYEL